jgi:hypothetical protein
VIEVSVKEPQEISVNVGETIVGNPDVVKSVNGIKPDENGNVDVISDVKIAELISALQ